MRQSCWCSRAINFDLVSPKCLGPLHRMLVYTETWWCPQHCLGCSMLASATLSVNQALQGQSRAVFILGVFFSLTSKVFLFCGLILILWVFRAASPLAGGDTHRLPWESSKTCSPCCFLAVLSVEVVFWSGL